MKTKEQEHDIINKSMCASSKDLDQPGHLHCLLEEALVDAQADVRLKYDNIDMQSP